MPDEINKKTTIETTKETVTQSSNKISPESLNPQVQSPSSAGVAQPGQADNTQKPVSSNPNQNTGMQSGGANSATGTGGAKSGGKVKSPSGNVNNGSAPASAVGSPLPASQTGTGAKPNVQYPGEEQNQDQTSQNDSKEKDKKKDDKDKDKEEEKGEKKDGEEGKTGEKEGETKKEVGEEGAEKSPATDGEKPKEAEPPAASGENPNKINPNDKNAERIAKIKNDRSTGDGLIDRAKRAHGNVNDLRDKYSVDGLKDRAKEKAAKVAKEALKKAARKAGLEAAKKAVLAALQAALDVVVGFFGWPVLVVCLAIFLILILIFAGLACSASSGYFGKTYPTPAGPTSVIVSTLKTKAAEAAKAPDSKLITGKKLLDYFDATDKTYVEEGKIDGRLAEALAYLTDIHSRLGISHIISGYKDMPTDPESGKDRDPKLVSNVSAHKDGLAADIAEIDFFYKVQNYNPHGGCSFTFYGDGSKNADLSELSDGTVLAPDTLGTSVDQIANTSKDNLESLIQTIKDIQSQLGANQGKIETSLGSEKGIYGDTQNDLTSAAGAASDIQAKLPAAYDKVKNLNQQIIASRAKIVGSTATETTDFTKQLDSAQIVLNETLQDYDRINSILNDITDKMIVNNESLNTVLDSASPDKDATKTVLNDIRTNAKYVVTIDSFTYISNITDLLTAFDNIYNKINELSDMIKNGILSDWAAKYADLTGQIGGADSILGGILGDKDKIFERGCSPDEARTVITSNTMYKEGIDPSGTVHVTQAIPIKVAWQDEKPIGAKVGDVGDLNLPSDPYLGMVDFNMVYRPEARRKTHQVITELLRFPYDKANVRYFRVTQLITFSGDRDVTPFASILDAIYGAKRPANYGLFSMPEAWAQVHVAY